jgi:hypothetical protein
MSQIEYQQRSNLFISKCWAKMKVSKRNEVRTTFDIDVYDEVDAQLWTSIFKMPWNSVKLNVQSVQHIKKTTLWKKVITSASELTEIFPDFYCCATRHQMVCLLLSSTVVGQTVKPMKVSLCHVQVMSWKENDHDILIDSSMKRRQYYLLRVSFQTITLDCQYERLTEEYANLDRE